MQLFISPSKRRGGLYAEMHLLQTVHTMLRLQRVPNGIPPHRQIRVHFGAKGRVTPLRTQP